VGISANLQLTCNWERRLDFEFKRSKVKVTTRLLDWIEQGLTSHSTHFRSFRRRWGDCGVSQDCSRSQSPQCVQCWVVCARPLFITVACMCIIWKALCPYLLDARLGLWVSLEHAFTCRTTRPHMVREALWEFWRSCIQTSWSQAAFLAKTYQSPVYHWGPSSFVITGMSVIVFSTISDFSVGTTNSIWSVLLCVSVV